MTVAVTGAGGSLGRALLASAGAGRRLVAFPEHAELDLAGPLDPVRAWMRAVAPRAIVHLAGRRGGADAATLMRDNVTATYNLLAAAVAAPEPIRVVIASSAAVYGRGTGDRPLRVTDAVRPINAYGVSKALQEEVAALSGADVRVARIFNIVGAPGDAWSVAPNLLARIAAAGDGEVVVGNAACVRDFVHVADVCAALVCAATEAQAPAVFNVATGSGTQIGSLARRIAELLGSDAKLRFDERLEAETIPFSVGDPGELRALGVRCRSLADADLLALRRESAA